MTPEKRKRLRVQLHSERSGKCFYCECVTVLCLDDTYRGPDRASLEHLQRKSEGGSDQEENIELACTFCNTRRGERKVKNHKKKMMRMVREGEHPSYLVQTNQIKMMEFQSLEKA